MIEPREFDAVLGGRGVPVDAAVLGGIAGAKRRFASGNVDVQIAALKDALRYGHKGIELLNEALDSGSEHVKTIAFFLLKHGETFLKINSPVSFIFNEVTVDRFGEIIKAKNRLSIGYLEELGSYTSLQMVLIPGTRLAMSAYPVTQQQWLAVRALPRRNIVISPIKVSDFVDGSLPIQMVNWHEANEFCDRISQKSGRSYRLPLVEEWQYACRAGTTTPFCFGETITTDLANYNGTVYADENPGNARRRTTPVGQFPANGFGLYDVHGNVWEICDRDSYSPAICGGSFFDSPFNCTWDAAISINVDVKDDAVGFRVVCEV